MDSFWTCSFCKKNFTQKNNLYVHIRKFHDTEPLPEKDFACNICNAQFSTQGTLSVHTKKFHNTDVVKKTTRQTQTRIICLYKNCEEMLFTFPNQRKHLTQKHGINIELEVLHFEAIAGKVFIISQKIKFFIVYFFFDSRV